MQLLADVGQREAAPLTHEQRPAQRLVEQAQLPTHRTMGHVQFGGGAGDAAQPRHRLERAQGIHRG